MLKGALSRRLTGIGWSPPIDDIKVIDPPSCFAIWGAISLARKNDALTLTSKILSQASSEQSSIGPNVGFVPAFETKISSG